MFGSMDFSKGMSQSKILSGSRALLPKLSEGMNERGFTGSFSFFQDTGCSAPSGTFAGILAAYLFYGKSIKVSHTVADMKKRQEDYPKRLERTLSTGLKHP